MLELLLEEYRVRTVSLCAGINAEKWQDLIPWPEWCALSPCCWWAVIPRMILLFPLPIPSIWDESFCLISPFPAFPALFPLEGKGQGRMWDVTGARENRRRLLVLSKEMLDIPSQDSPLKPGLFPYGKENGRWAQEEFLQTRPSEGWRSSQGRCSEERNQFISLYSSWSLYYSKTPGEKLSSFPLPGSNLGIHH